MQRIENYLSHSFYYSFYSSFFRVISLSLLLIELFFNSEFIFMYINDLTQISRTGNGLYVLLKNNYLYFFVAYLVLLLLGILGIGKNFTLFLIYIFYFVQSQLFPFTKWIDSIMVLNLLFLSFADSFRYFSLNKSTPRINTTQNMVSNLSIYCIIVHLCYMYLVNAFGKLHSEYWTSGVALYAMINEYPLVIGRDFMIRLFSIKPILLFSTYLVLLYQLFFSILVFIPQTKKGTILIGILIHLSMAVLFLLVKFQLMIVLLFGFLFTDKQWEKLVKKVGLYFSK